METQTAITKCKDTALQIRKDIIEMTYQLGNMGAHLGGSLSMVEILSVLYTQVGRFDAENLQWEYRDRVILSKGHGALALYPALASAHIIDRNMLQEFKKNGSLLSGHPSLNGLAGIEFASGSLGQGLSLGVGVALALKRKENPAKVYVILGDGECDEGSVWEAAASAAHYELDNLIAIVDANAIQYDGYTDEILRMNPWCDKWEAFGWKVIEVDGHDVAQLLQAFDSEHCKQPLVIIANTIKGKGISFMEGNKSFHNARLTSEQYQKAMQELESCS